MERERNNIYIYIYNLSCDLNEYFLLVKVYHIVSYIISYPFQTLTIEAYNHLISLSRLRGVPEAGAGLTAADAAPMQLRGCGGKAERDRRRP